MRALIYAAAILGLGLTSAFAQNAAPSAAGAASKPTDATPKSPTVDVAKYIDIQPGREQSVQAAVRKYAVSSRAQDGNHRELILQELGRPSRLLIVEQWADAATYSAHLASESTGQFNKATTSLLRAPNDERANGDFLAQNGEPAPMSAVYVVTHLDVNPPNRPKTEALLSSLVDASRGEKGAIEFNVYRPQTALNHFTVSEIWSSFQTFKDHGAAPSTLAFRQSAAPLIGALYDERLYKLLR